MISCLMITQAGRLAEISRAIACFRSQTFTPRELVIVHDGSDDFHHQLLLLIESEPDRGMFQIHQAQPGHALGELRNVSVKLAKYPLVCQWDDDDLYHPRRLEIQFAYLRIHGADFCFLTDQLHLFEDNRLLFWDDWNVESPPGNLIQGTLLGNNSMLGEYPALARGEDTPVVMDLIRRGHKIAALSGMGWIYIYVYTGKNAWEREHHLAISSWKHLSDKRFIPLQGELEVRLREYPTVLGSVNMPARNELLPLHIGPLLSPQSGNIEDLSSLT